MSEPMEHILRSQPPWRDDSQAKTECGKPVAEFATVITRDEAIRKFRKQGKHRAAMSTCMTCINTTNRHDTWESNPASCISRDISSWTDADALINQELRAVALLIQAHREEWDQALGDLENVDRLEVRRAEKRYR